MTYSEFRKSQKKYQTQEGAIAYVDQGDGPVILLLHGIPTSGWLYRHMIPILVAAGHRVIAPDMLGFGNSDSPKGYELYSEEKHGARLLQLMEGLGINQWTHIMHDAGGLWSWELIKSHANCITHIVLLNTIIYEAGFKPPIRFKPGIPAKIAMWSYRNGFTTNMMLNGLFKSGLTENTLSKTDLDGYRTPLLEGKTRAMYYFFTQTCNTLTDYSGVIKKINVPTLVVWGKNDSFLKWEPQGEAIISDLNISPENIHLLDAKHFIQEERPQEIAEHILTFLNQD